MADGFQMIRGGRSTRIEIVLEAYQSRWMREHHTFHPDGQREDLPTARSASSAPSGATASTPSPTSV